MRRTVIIIQLALTAFVCNAQTSQQADSLHQRGRELADEGKIAEARACDLQAMEIRKKLFGEVNEDYISSLNNYALTFSMEENYVKASELQEHMMDLCARLKSPHPKLGLFAQNTGYTFFQLDNKEKAVKYWEMALPVTEKFSKKYEALLKGLALLYDGMEDKQGESRIMALMEEHNQHELTLPCDEPKCMLERAQYYAATGNTTLAKEHFLKLFTMTMDDAMRADAYYGYASFLHANHDDAAAAENARMAVEARLRADGKTEAYAHLANYAALLSRSARQYKQALGLYHVVVDFFSTQDTPYGRKRIAQAQRNMGACYAAIKQRLEAKNCYMKALSYYEKEGQDDEDYPKTIVRIADMERYMRDYEAAITHYQQAMALMKTMGLMEEYNRAAQSLRSCYTAMGRQDEVELMEQKAKAEQHAKLDKLIADSKANLEMDSLYLGQTTYANTLGAIGGCYHMKEELDSAAAYFRQYIVQEREALRTEFRMKSEGERMAMWNSESMNIGELMQLLMTANQGNPKLLGDVAAIAYDAQLLAKGILLRSSIEFEKVLEAKGDTATTNLYNRTKALEAQIDSLRQRMQPNDDLMNLVALTQQEKTLQMKLYQTCAEVADFTDYLSYDWNNVQKAMDEKDVAIEFASVSGTGTREEQMVALVLTKDMKTPVPVVLWDNRRLEACDESEVFVALRDSIFRHHMNDLFRKKNDSHALGSISGTGINMQFLKDMKVMTDQTDTPFKPELVLLIQHLMTEYAKNDSISSPIGLQFIRYNRLIEENDSIFTSPEASQLIWGQLQPYLQGKKRIFFAADGCLNRVGIENMPHDGRPLSEQFEVYRLSSTKELCYKHESRKPTKAALFGDINYNDEATKSKDTQRSIASLRGSSEAGSFADLSNTLREVDGIQAVLKSKGVKDAVLFRDIEASKSNFMSLTDTKVNILHIATHGMYRDKKKSTDAESMQNSLLAFAGANLDDNSLVTAADIATMNLRQCELAVLSACETGLGKLGGDGVFGLQRGFKNAGVHTLLMSLKNVYDESTADLMINFYQHLMNGATKREALVKAQQDIRKKGFNDPKYWASFILLDAFSE